MRYSLTTAQIISRFAHRGSVEGKCVLLRLWDTNQSTPLCGKGELISTLLNRSIPFHLVAGLRSRDGWDVPAWVLQRASSMTILSGAGQIMMLEDQQRFLSIICQLIPG